MRSRLPDLPPGTNGHAADSAAIAELPATGPASNPSPDPSADSDQVGAIATGQAARPARAAAVEALLWTLEEAADALRVSPRTLKRMAAAGVLPAGAVVRPFGRLRLFSRPILERWVSEGCPRARSGARQRHGSDGRRGG
jgi:excisionase family DNA binding protein